MTIVSQECEPAPRRYRHFAVAVVAVMMTLLAGCGPDHATASAPQHSTATTSTVPVGRAVESLRSGGLTRTFDLYRPPTLASPAPLVVMLHGGYGDGTQAETSDHWDPAADNGHFLAVFPNGYRHSWNAGGGCCGKAAADNVNDVAFIRAVVAKVRAELPIDPKQIYVAGMSNGAIMAYRLACQTHLFAAAASVAGTILADCKHAHPASLLQIHGRADKTVPYGGGPGQSYNGKGNDIDGPSVPADNRTWRKIDKCHQPHHSTAGVVSTSVAHCPRHRAVKLISIAGAGHQWPGSTARPWLERVLHTDPPSTALNATATIWTFFAHHPS